MNIAVVDDERIIREQICGLIENQRQNCKIKAYSSGEEIVASDERFNIIFLDIKMSGIGGIETARRLREKSSDTILIFVTGVKEYVFDALDLYAFQYLLKPINERKFAEVLERAVKEAEKKTEKQELFIKSKKLTIDQADILYIESSRKKVEIHTVGSKKTIEIYASMDELEKELDKNFYRCHRSYIVNMSHIAEYNNDSITVTGGEKVYLSKKKYSEFKKAYMWHLQNGGVHGV